MAVRMASYDHSESAGAETPCLQFVRAAAASCDDEALRTAARRVLSALEADASPTCAPTGPMEQYYLAVEREEWKLETLCELLEVLSELLVGLSRTRSGVPAASRPLLVLVNPASATDVSSRVEWLAARLDEYGLPSARLHAGQDREEMQRVSARLRTGEACAVVASSSLPVGVIESGLGGVHCALIISYDFPRNRERYALRVGRRQGDARAIVLFLTSEDLEACRDLERFLNERICELPVDIMDLIQLRS